MNDERHFYNLFFWASMLLKKIFDATLSTTCFSSTKSSSQTEVNSFQMKSHLFKTSFEKMSWFECCTNIVCCQDMWELYFECKKIKETVQTVNFTVFTMCGRELPAEMTYFWWKLEKRKRIFLNDFHQYDLNGVYHEKADVLRIPKML